MRYSYCTPRTVKYRSSYRLHREHVTQSFLDFSWISLWNFRGFYGAHREQCPLHWCYRIHCRSLIQRTQRSCQIRKTFINILGLCLYIILICFCNFFLRHKNCKHFKKGSRYKNYKIPYDRDCNRYRICGKLCIYTQCTW